MLFYISPNKLPNLVTLIAYYACMIPVICSAHACSDDSSDTDFEMTVDGSTLAGFTGLLR